jgi:hypothetical protein
MSLTSPRFSGVLLPAGSHSQLQEYTWNGGDVPLATSCVSPTLPDAATSPTPRTLATSRAHVSGRLPRPARRHVAQGADARHVTLYREWTPLLSREESRLRLGSLLTQISKAAEHGSRVAIHGDFNVDLDRGEDKGYYMAKFAESLAKCTSAPGLEAHVTSLTFRSFGNFVPYPAGDHSRPPGDLANPTGGGPSPAGGGPSPAGDGQSPAEDFHRYARLDHVYTKGLISESKVIPDATTDHRPVVTTVRAGGRCLGTTKLVSLKRRNFKAIKQGSLRGL